MADLLLCNRMPGRSAVGQEEFLDVVAVGLEHHAGAAMVADLLVGPLDHAVTLAGPGGQNFAAAGDLEALFGARFGLQFGHLALLWRAGCRRGQSPPSAAMALNALSWLGIELSRRHGSPVGRATRSGA